jgi:chromosome segregation ATPase
MNPYRNNAAAKKQRPATGADGRGISLRSNARNGSRQGRKSTRCGAAANGMGAVNLVAIEEYAELKQRHDFLANQVNDLTTSKAELLKAIDEINQTSLQQFQVTFEQIRKELRVHVPHAVRRWPRASRADPGEDILESGIEIVAQPPARSSRASRCCRADRRRSRRSRCCSRSTW